MDDVILITELNDYIFCPVSIYFHKLYGDTERVLYQKSDQINGTNAHQSIDQKTYSSQSHIMMSTEVYSDRYRLFGKIDIYDSKRKLLRERKKHIVKIYDGYVFQVYAQCIALREMGYDVQEIELYSIDVHKKYTIPLPENDLNMFQKFQKTIDEMRSFSMDAFQQLNIEKCKRCIYEPACDRTLLE